MVQIRNPHQTPITLPWPLRGMLRPGQIINLPLVKATLNTLLKGLDPQLLEVDDTPAPYPFDTAYQGFASDADPYATVGLAGSNFRLDGLGGVGWGPEGFVANTWEMRGGMGASITLRGCTINNSGTVTGRAIADTNDYTRQLMTEYLVTTPATDAFARVTQNGDVGVWRDAFDLWWYTGCPDLSAGHAYMNSVGTTAGVTVGVQPSAYLNFCGIGFEATHTNWMVMHNDGTGAATLIDTGMVRPVVARTDIYMMRLRKLPGTSVVQWSIRRRSDNVRVSGVTGSADLPAVATAWRQQLIGTNPGATKTAGVCLASFGGMHE